MNLKISNNILMTLSGMFIFQSTSFLVALFLSRTGRFDVFGQYQFFISTCSFFILIAKSGLDEKISFSYTEKQNWNTIDPKQNKIISNLNIAFFASLLGSVFTVLFYLFYSIFSEVKIDFFTSLYAFLYIPPFILVIMISSFFRAQNDIFNRTISTYYIPSLLFISFLCFIHLFVELNIYLFLIARVLTYILAAIFCFSIIHKKFKVRNFVQVFNYKNLNINYLKKELLNWFVFPLICFLFETGTYFIWILRSLQSDEFIGKFTVVFKLASLVLILPIAISIVIAPYAVKKFKEKNTLSFEKYVIIIVTLTSSILLLTIYYFYGSELMIFLNPILTGFKYELLFLSSSLTLIAITSPLQSLMLAEGKIQDVFKINLLAIIVATIPLCWFSSSDSFTYCLSLISISIFIFGFIRLSFIFKVQ
jgi:O-antigen/teichoic acid export membrane protein